MQKLQILINMLEKGRNIHISILDLSGVLNTPLTELDFANVIHSAPFCNAAKSTDKGYRACLRCKALANHRAVRDAKPFSGHCFFGLYETAYPVNVDVSVAAVIYVGNTVLDLEKTEERIDKMCTYTAVSGEKLRRELDSCERITDPDELTAIAELVADYLRQLGSVSHERRKLHWLVAAMKRQADELYSTDLSLKYLAALYRKNEKYIGRLFKREMKVSFDEYCMAKRLERAESLLAETDLRVIDIAIECGFGSISYFNRAFLKRRGMPPTEYRKAKCLNN